MTDASSERLERLAVQRRSLPDQPGVYLFYDRRGKVIYVGKALSIKKRVAGHFTNPVVRGSTLLTDVIEQIDFLVVTSETEALLVEQNFIKQYQPRFNIRLRDDKSYPYIAISMDERFPRVYFTREKHRRSRLYFGPYSSAKRTRSTLETLAKVFQYRSCTGAEPGRRSGSPCLDFYIKRCSAPCIAEGADREQYMEAIDGVRAFLSGRYAEVLATIEGRMHAAAAAEEFEQATLERNRLQAIEALMQRQRVTNEAVGTIDVVAVAIAGGEANAQVFQVRDGLLSDRQSFYLDNVAGAEDDEIVGQFLLRYYGEQTTIPPQVIVPPMIAADAGPLASLLTERRGKRVDVRAAERGDKARLYELAVRNAALALDQDRLKAERRRQQRAGALEGLKATLGLAALPIRIECYDISNLMGTHTVASMVVFEGGAPKKSDYRRFKIRGLKAGVADDFAAMNEVLCRRIAAFMRRQEFSPHDPDYDASFAALPNLIVIDGGRGQLSAGLAALGEFRARGVAVISLAKRIEEIFMPGSGVPIVIDHARPELQLLQQVRDEAHRFAIDHHRKRRDSAMTSSVLDGLPGIGPARKRALLVHFGAPDAVLAASREELESVLPGKTARDLYSFLHRTRTGR